MLYPLCTNSESASGGRRGRSRTDSRLAICLHAGDESFHLETLGRRVRHLGNGMNHPRAQMAIAFELRLIKELIGGALMRKILMAGVVGQNVGRFRAI